jgi:hypothetical protein
MVLNTLSAEDCVEQYFQIEELINHLHKDVETRLAADRTTSIPKKETAIMRLAGYFAEEAVSHRFAEAMIPRDIRADYYNFYVNVEIVAQWCKISLPAHSTTWDEADKSFLFSPWLHRPPGRSPEQSRISHGRVQVDFRDIQHVLRGCQA